MNATLKPMITTIIPTYRRPQLLKQTILSVLDQTYPHFQVCVYDNASGDETAAIVAEIAKDDHRVKYYCHAENIGAFDNFQFGLKHVETPYFSFLSDDDLVLPEFYQTALAGFKNHPEAMFSATDVIHEGVNGNILKLALETWTPGFYQPPKGLIEVLKHGHSEWTGILFRKEVTETVGLLDQETGKFSDLDFTLRIAARCPFVVSKQLGAIFNQSMTLTRAPYSFDLSWPGILKMIRNLTDDESIPLDARNHAEHVLWVMFEKELFSLGISYLSRGYPADAKKVAALIRDQFKGWVRSIALFAIIYTHQYVPFVRLAFSSLIGFRRYIRTKQVDIQDNHDKYCEAWAKYQAARHY